MPCLACDRIAACRAGAFAHFVVELPESFVVLADDQRYFGHCILLAKEHVEHLANWPVERQRQLFGDVASVAAAVRAVVNPVRLNYECLGNQLAHVHWHVIPRHAWDPEPGETIWVRPLAERKTGTTREELDRLLPALRREL